jgi:hypothetical protein
LGLTFAFGTAEAVIGAVGKWESRGFCEISKGVWEPVKTCGWFSPASMLLRFPRRFALATSATGRPVVS